MLCTRAHPRFQVGAGGRELVSHPLISFAYTPRQAGAALGLGEFLRRPGFDDARYIWRQLLQLCGYNKLGHPERTGTSPGAPSPWQPKLHSMF